uniref:Sushi domain-containing protein n=1 Tax=Tetraodon nigroviridis TaxID=99883 RepID=H3C127_TETNG
FFCISPQIGDCERPQATETFVLGTDALLLNQFPEGIQVSLQCANGYDRISGSGSTVCSNGQWSKPDLFCKKKDCGQPKAKPNMKFHISKGTQFRAIIGVSCDEGLITTLRGSSYQQCLATGWILANSRCQIVTCDRPGHVTNGNSSWTSEELPKYGETVQYTCNEGFTLVGKENITCTKNGKFNSQPPKCQ